LRRRGDTMTVQAQGQPEFELGYDDHGDFYPLRFDALLRPLRDADGRYGFAWSQNGATVQAHRREPDAAARSIAPEPVDATGAAAAGRIGEFVGDYPLAPDFVLSVRQRGDALFAQATGQSALRLLADGPNRFRVVGVDAWIEFERGPDGAVAALILHQNGRAQHAPRH